MAVTVLVALIDLAIFAGWSLWHFHGPPPLYDNGRLAVFLLLNLGYYLLLAVPTVVVAASFGLLTGLLIREWRYGNRYVLAAPSAILLAAASAVAQYDLFHQHRPVAVIGAALIGAVTGPIPVLLLVWARRRFGTPEDPPTPRALTPRRPNLVWYALIWMTFATQTGILFLVALAALMGFAIAPHTFVGSSSMVGPMYVLLAVPATPTAVVSGALLGWLIAMTPLGRTERRARVVGAVTATSVPTAVLVLYSVLAVVGDRLVTGNPITAPGVLPNLLSLMASEIGALYAIAVMVACLGGSFVGFNIFSRLHSMTDGDEPMTVAP